MYHFQIHIYVNFKLCYNPTESKQEGKWKYILRAYPLLQHFVVEVGLEVFHYLKIIKRQTIKVISSHTLAQLVPCYKFNFNHSSYITDPTSVVTLLALCPKSCNIGCCHAS